MSLQTEKPTVIISSSAIFAWHTRWKKKHPRQALRLRTMRRISRRTLPPSKSKSIMAQTKKEPHGVVCMASIDGFVTAVVKRVASRGGTRNGAHRCEQL